MSGGGKGIREKTERRWERDSRKDRAALRNLPSGEAAFAMDEHARPISWGKSL